MHGLLLALADLFKRVVQRHPQHAPEAARQPAFRHRAPKLLRAQVPTANPSTAAASFPLRPSSSPPSRRPLFPLIVLHAARRDAYIEARRRAKLISPSIQLPDIVEGGALPTVPERTASAKGLSHALSVGRAPRASPLPDNDAPADADAHDERRGPKEAARERAGAIPSAAAIRQRSRARAQGPAGHHWGSPGPVGEFDGSVAQVIPRAELGGGEEEEEGAARTDYEGAADGSDDGEGECA